MNDESKYKVVFKRDVGKLFDFLIVIENGFNNNKLPNTKYLKKRNLIPSKYVEDLFNNIWETADIDSLGLALFFTSSENKKCYCFEKYLSKIYELGDIQSFIDGFINENHKANLLSYYDSNSKKANYYESILKDEKKLVDLINTFSINTIIKWELSLYCLSEEKFNKSLKKVFNDFHKELEKVYDKNMNLVNSFESQIKFKNNSNSEKFFLYNEFSKSHQKSSNNKTEINIAVSLLHEIVVMSYGYCNYILGLSYAKQIVNKNIDNEILEVYEMIRVLSDSNRLKLLVTLKNSEIYAGELAKIIGLANSTTSYHLDMLFYRNLLKRKKSGKNIAYTINKEKVLELLEEVKRLLS